MFSAEEGVRIIESLPIAPQRGRTLRRSVSRLKGVGVVVRLPLPSKRSAVKRAAAVDDEFRAHRPAGFVRGQVQHGLGHFVRVPKRPSGMVAAMSWLTWSRYAAGMPSLSYRGFPPGRG